LSKKLLVCICALCLIAFAATSASATIRIEKFALLGNGGFMDSPPCFGGDIIGGTLSPGTFWLCFNDTGWPVDNPATPQNERWDYIFAHYFSYVNTPGAEGWTGYFPPVGSGEPSPTWRFFKATGDTLGGICSQITITIRDYNANGIVDPGDYAQRTISGNMVVYVNFSRGVFESYCGSGSFSGNVTVTNPSTGAEQLYVPSASSATGSLILKNTGCTVAVESQSWGQIKSLYRD
jgi:hypothetical protein